MATVPRQFRLSEETLSLIDAVQAKMGLSSRADVLRVAVKRLADAEKVKADRPKKIPKNLSR